MSNDVALRARFLADVVDRECEHLAYTTHRLFPSQKAVTEEQVTEWTRDPELAERLDAGREYAPQLIAMARTLVAETRRRA